MRNGKDSLENLGYGNDHHQPVITVGSIQIDAIKSVAFRLQNQNLYEITNGIEFHSVTIPRTAMEHNEEALKWNHNEPA